MAATDNPPPAPRPLCHRGVVPNLPERPPDRERSGRPWGRRRRRRGTRTLHAKRENKKSSIFQHLLSCSRHMALHIFLHTTPSRIKFSKSPFPLVGCILLAKQNCPLTSSPLSSSPHHHHHYRHMVKIVIHFILRPVQLPANPP